MVTQNPVRVGMPLNEFLEAGEERLFEFIDGEKIYRMSNVYGHRYLIKWIVTHFQFYLDKVGAGEVDNELTYTVSDSSQWVKGSRIPDVACYSDQRIATYRQTTPDWLFKPLRLVPDLTIELVSPSETDDETDKKVNADLANGVKIVWVINMTTQLAYVHTLKGVTHVPADGTLTTDLLPDFGLSLPDLFATLSEA